MAAVIIFRDSGAKKINSLTVSIVSPSTITIKFFSNEENAIFSLCELHAFENVRHPQSLLKCLRAFNGLLAFTGLYLYIPKLISMLLVFCLILTYGYVARFLTSQKDSSIPCNSDQIEHRSVTDLCYEYRLKSMVKEKRILNRCFIAINLSSLQNQLYL